MRQSFLGRLQRNGWFSLSGALFLLLLVPILQLLVLGPQGYNTALAAPLTSLIWIQAHTALFLLYRLALILGFALLLALPFALFRIIVAQEIVGRAEIAEDEEDDDESGEDEDEQEAQEENDDENDADEDEQEAQKEASEEENGMPPFAWRGKGFAVIGAWTGLVGLVLTAGGILASSIYLWSSASANGPHVQLPDNFASVTSLFTVLTYTIGGGLIALACIFFGLIIARSGRKLWPDGWVAFGYMALATGAIASGSAVQVALAPDSGQATLTTPAILLLAIWSLWFGVMVVRLKAEA